MRREQLNPISFVVRHSFLIGTSVFILVPFVWMLSLSIKPPQEFFQQNISLLPKQFYGVENYTSALTGTPLFRFMWNGVVVSGVTLLAQIALAAPCAYALAKTNFRGRDFVFGLVLIGLLIPQQVLAIPIFIAFYWVGILDTYSALILPGIVSPVAIFLFRQFFKAVPDDLVHAARLDGLSELSIVWRIMLPASLPAVGAFAVLSVVGRWNDLFWPLILIRSENMMTPPQGIVFFKASEGATSFGPLMAAAFIIVIPMVLFFMFFQKKFIDGITMGGATK